MPIYNYVCHKCNHEEQKLLSMKERMAAQTCSKCGAMTFQQLPSGVESFTYEIKDHNRGKQVKKGVESQLKTRNKEHHDRYEVAQKIDQYGLEDATKLGWVKSSKKL